MLGFTLPLLVFGGVEGVIALLLLLPLPLCRPAILVCKLTNTHAGRTVVICIASFLGILLLAPIYDIAVLHQYKVTFHTILTSIDNRVPEICKNKSAAVFLGTSLPDLPYDWAGEGRALR